MAKGKKICPSCDKKQGVRVIQCDCKYHFFYRKMLSEMILPIIIQKEYSLTGRGKKKCPRCQKIIGARTKVCLECQYAFLVYRKREDKAVKKTLYI